MVPGQPYLDHIGECVLSFAVWRFDVFHPARSTALAKVRGFPPAAPRKQSRKSPHLHQTTRFMFFVGPVRPDEKGAGT